MVPDMPTFATCGEDKGPLNVLFFGWSGVMLVLPECTMFCFAFEASVFFFSGILQHKRCDCNNEAYLLATEIWTADKRAWTLPQVEEDIGLLIKDNLDVTGMHHWIIHLVPLPITGLSKDICTRILNKQIKN